MQANPILSVRPARAWVGWTYLLLALLIGTSALLTAAPSAVAAITTGTVVAWGDNTYGAASVPANLTNVVAIAGGTYHNLALKQDGTVVAWGNNSDGQSNVPAGLTNVVAIAGGGYFSLALKQDGTLVAWGNNFYGQTNVPAGLTNVTALATGYDHSLALKGDGTVVAWGSNLYGQSNVPAGLANITALAAGALHSLALKGDGTVVAWGRNNFGQVNVPAGLSNVTAIAAGAWHNLALKGDGTVIAWGYNSSGQRDVPAGLSNVVAIAAGGSHSLALKGDGTIVAWGYNGFGQSTVPAGLGNVLALAAGGNHSVALQQDAPTLSIPNTAQTVGGNYKFSVPVNFTSNGASIASVGFALTYDQTCLTLDLTDANSDGIPDAVSGLPAAFAPSLSYNASNNTLEVALYDDIQPISTFSDGALFSVQFTVVPACVTTDGSTQNVTVGFAASPLPTFGDPTGQDVAGSSAGATIPLHFNAAPTALALSNNSVNENSAAATTVGTLSTTDANGGDSHTYSLVGGIGGNASFTLAGATLQTADLFDYETKNSYTAIIRTTDSGGLFFDQLFTIQVGNVYEAPLGVGNGSDGANSDGNPATLDLHENVAAGAIVATLAPANPDAGNSYTYQLVSGTGSDDNASFTLDSNGVLKANAAFDYENQSSYTIRVKITDNQGATVEQILTILVNDQPEAPVAVDDVVDPRTTIFLGGQGGDIAVLANDLANGGILQVVAVTQPAAGQGSVANNSPVLRYTAPPANGSTSFTYRVGNGLSLGDSNSATVSVNYVANNPRGDCNGNASVTAADFIATVLEIFDTTNSKGTDNEPAWWLTYTGSYAGSPRGCDANASGNPSAGNGHYNASVTAADITCTVLLFFGHPCGGGQVAAAGATQAAGLSVAAIKQGGQTTLPVTLATNGHAVAAAVFALDLGAAAFDATDANRDGVPDAVTLTITAGMNKSVTWNAQAHRLEVALYGASLPLPSLQDGALATVTVTTGTTAPKLTLLSLSDPAGNDLLVDDNTSQRISVFLPFVVR